MIGSFGIIGVMITAVGLLIALLSEELNLGAMIGAIFVGLAIFFVVFLLALMINGGVSMLNLRSHKHALIAAYLMAGLSFAGCYAILFSPFGIWGLVVLHLPDVRREFQRSPPESAQR